MFETVIDFLKLQTLYSGVAFLLALLGTWLLRRQSAVWHLGLWSIVLVRLIVPPGFSTSLSLGSLLDNTGVGIRAHQHDSQATAADLSDGLPAAVAGASMPASPVSPLPHGAEIWFWLWIAGLLAVTTVFLRRLHFYRRVTGGAREVREPVLTAMCQAWRSEFRIRRPVRLLSSDVFLSPFTSGIRRPQIYLPERLLRQTDPTTLEAVIAHEMAHIHRWDQLWLRWQNLLQVVYFFHPLLWLANKRLNHARERRCDEMVLATGRIAPASYAASLIKVLNMKLIGAPNWQLNHSFAGSAGPYKARIQVITGGSIMKKTHPIPTTAALILFAAFVIPMAPAPRAASSTNLYFSQTHPIPAPLLLLGSDARQPVDFTLPIKTGYVSADYDSMRHPETGERVMHKGIDIAARRGVKVYAAAAGRVAAAEDQSVDVGGYGKYVVIDHGDEVQSLYAHMSRLLVQAGSEVAKGQLIGRVGNSGVSTGPHLHFEIRESGRHLDPETRLSFDTLLR